MLLSQAKPGDRVLYTSIISMPYYFIQGAMQLGAMYYNPALKGNLVEDEMLGKQKLTFCSPVQSYDVSILLLKE